MPISQCFTMFLNILLLALYICTVDSASPDFCLVPLNKSDCGLAPTAVFSYYKPGSICQIEMWKGCPTINKFHSQQECSSLCIKNTEVADENNKCDALLNANHCSLQPKQVYTFSKEKQTCVEADWYGCPTPNKFNDRQTCVDACLKRELEWADKIRRKDMDFIKGLYKVIEELVKTNDTNHFKKHFMGKNNDNEMFESNKQTTLESHAEEREGEKAEGSNVDNKVD